MPERKINYGDQYGFVPNWVHPALMNACPNLRATCFGIWFLGHESSTYTQVNTVYIYQPAASWSMVGLGDLGPGVNQYSLDEYFQKLLSYWVN